MQEKLWLHSLNDHAIIIPYIWKKSTKSSRILKKDLQNRQVHNLAFRIPRHLIKIHTIAWKDVLGVQKVTPSRRPEYSPLSCFNRKTPVYKRRNAILRSRYPRDSQIDCASLLPLSIMATQAKSARSCSVDTKNFSVDRTSHPIQQRPPSELVADWLLRGTTARIFLAQSTQNDL